MSTYKDRFFHFVDVIKPHTLFTTQAQIDEAKQIIEKGAGKEKEDAAQKLLDAVVHPDTGEMIPAPFRMAAFVPMNMPIALGMLHPSQQTPLRGMFWQIANQSNNVAFNYCNRNISSTDGGQQEAELQQVFKSYLLAVGVSCSVSVLGSKLTQRAVASGNARAKVLSLFVPYTAVVCASLSNVFAMRRSEYFDGIQLLSSPDHKTAVVVANGEKSRVAGAEALSQVMISRALIPMPIMGIPPVIMAYIRSSVLKPTTPRGVEIAVNLAVLFCVFTLALPSCIAVFPQTGCIETSKLEPRFQNVVDPNSGKKLEVLYYNKGI
eukprot:PhM_4_TR12863/c0_g1_i1/m.24725